MNVKQFFNKIDVWAKRLHTSISNKVNSALQPLTSVIANSDTFNPFTPWGRLKFQQPHTDRTIAWQFESWNSLPVTKGTQGKETPPSKMGGEGIVSMIEDENVGSPMFV